MIVVNPNTRQFNIPGSDLVFGVEYDAGSEIKQFQCPRYVGNNVDLAGSFIRINWRNANGDIDSYLVEDVIIDGDNVLFSWELSPNVTRYKGQIRFVLCVIGADLKLKWHTTTGSGQVLEGLEPDHATVADETADVVAQLIQMANNQVAAVEAEGEKQINAVQSAAEAAKTTAVAQIEAKGTSTLSSIPEDYAALSDATNEQANAVKGKLVGTAVRADDVSPLEHVMTVKVTGVDDPATVKVRRCGKNLSTFPYSEAARTRAGITYAVSEDGVITMDGTSTGSYFGLATKNDAKIYLRAGVTYTLSGLPAGVNMNSVYAYITEADGTKHFVTEHPTTFVASTSDYVGFTVVVSDSNTVSDMKFKPMLEVSGTASAFEPYSGEDYTPAADGTVGGVTSLSPTLTLLTDTPGVTVECEYNRDTNKVIGDILSKIAALGGI